jgi:hypothetical protein
MNVSVVLVLGGLATMLGGCAAASVDQDAVAGAPRKLGAASVAYIAVPADGHYGDENYPYSGKMVAEALDGALLRHVAEVDEGTAPQSFSAALSSAQQHSAVYLVYPQIAHWEDRATEWDGLPDRIEVVVSVYNVKDGALVDRGTITGKSSWFTIGGDHPQDLLPKPVNAYVDELF